MRMRAQGLVWLLSVLWMLGCGGSSQGVGVVTAPPRAPEPPRAPLAWMPEDSTLLGRASIAAFRGTPIWELWANFQQKRKELQFWIDSDLVDEVMLSATQLDQPQPSFVAAVRGRFGEGYLEQLAIRDQLVGENRGLLRVYQRPEAIWVQVTSELVVACSHDRAEWLVQRSATGDGEPIRDTDLYASLAERSAFAQSHLVVLIDDPEGKGKQRLEADSSRLGVGLPDAVIDEIKRVGLTVSMGPEISLQAVAESISPEGAETIRSTVVRSLDALSSNMFVAMFGLRPFVKAIHAETQAGYVRVYGKYRDADLYELIDKLKSVLGMAMARGGATSEP